MKRAASSRGYWKVYRAVVFGIYPMPDLGQSLPKWLVGATSAFIPIAVQERMSRDVSKVLTAEVRAAASRLRVCISRRAAFDTELQTGRRKGTWGKALRFALANPRMTDQMDQNSRQLLLGTLAYVMVIFGVIATIGATYAGT